MNEGYPIKQCVQGTDENAEAPRESGDRTGYESSVYLHAKRGDLRICVRLVSKRPTELGLTSNAEWRTV
jgi:hypothetical protein